MSSSVVFAENGAVREKGWIAILLSAAAFLIVPLVPQIRVVVPVEQTLLLLVPAIAASALVAWWLGGQLWLAVAWLGMAGWMISRPLHADPTYDALARGWAIMLAAVFGLVSLTSPRRSFAPRALSALGLTTVFAFAIVVLSGVSPSRVDRALSAELARRVAASTVRSESHASRSGDGSRGSPAIDPGGTGGGDGAMTGVGPALTRLSDFTQQRSRELASQSLPLFPALLAVESLVGLGLAWGLFHRFSRARIGPPLPALRTFRVSEELVWGLLVGLVILTVPSLAPMRGLGLNLVVFFGVLYLLDGIGVVSWFVMPRIPAVLLASALFAALAVVWPVVGVTVLGLIAVLGVLDNWLDWRRTVRHAA